jgi:hypothetical protein
VISLDSGPERRFAFIAHVLDRVIVKRPLPMRNSAALLLVELTDSVEVNDPPCGTSGRSWCEP